MLVSCFSSAHLPQSSHGRKIAHNRALSGTRTLFSVLSYIHLVPTVNLRGWYCYLCFTGKETEAHVLAYLRFHSWLSGRTAPRKLFDISFYLA